MVGIMKRKLLLQIVFLVTWITVSFGSVFGQTDNMVEISGELFNKLKADDKYVRETFPSGYDSDVGQIFCDEVQLNADNEPEYIITMIGGNSSGPIWIYRKTRTGYQQILNAGTMTYSLLKTKTRGYYDLRFEWGGNSGGYYLDIFAFNGRKYTRKTRKHRMDRMPT